MAGVGPALLSVFLGTTAITAIDGLIDGAKKIINFIFGTDMKDSKTTRKNLIQDTVDSLKPLNDIDAGLGTKLDTLSSSVLNFVTSFNFIEENGAVGSTNVLENTTTLNFDERNFVTFKTRQNRKIDLTEYYDLIYEYKNDCLTASIKYNKTYYEDRDLQPTEDFMLSIKLIPLTAVEQKFVY